MSHLFYFHLMKEFLSSFVKTALQKLHWTFHHLTPSGLAVNTGAFRGFDIQRNGTYNVSYSIACFANNNNFLSSKVWCVRRRTKTTSEVAASGSPTFPTSPSVGDYHTGSTSAYPVATNWRYATGGLWEDHTSLATSTFRDAGGDEVRFTTFSGSVIAPLLANDIIFFEATCNIGWKVYGTTYNDHHDDLVTTVSIHNVD